MSEQARKIRHKAMPEWAEGLYYNSGMLTSSGIIRKDGRPPIGECLGLWGGAEHDKGRDPVGPRPSFACLPRGRGRAHRDVSPLYPRQPHPIGRCTGRSLLYRIRIS
jgi:hypothetical protein